MKEIESGNALYPHLDRGQTRRITTIFWLEHSIKCPQVSSKGDADKLHTNDILSSVLLCIFTKWNGMEGSWETMHYFATCRFVRRVTGL